MREKINRDKLIFVVLLVLELGFQVLPRIAELTWGNGVATILWLCTTLELVGRFRNRNQLVMTGVAFLLGYELKFAGAMGITWINLAIFGFVGMIFFGAFLLAAYIMQRWTNMASTLALPLIWSAEYMLATICKLPSLVRIDMMFTDMIVLIQAELVIGSFGLSFALLWIVALIRYSSATQSRRCLVAALLIFFMLMAPGVFYITNFI